METPTNTTDTKINDKDDKTSDVESGWAWVVALAGLIATFLGFGVHRSLGMLLFELKDIYETSTTEVSLIISFVGTGYTLSALLLMFGLGDIFHERIMVASAGVSSSIGFIVTFSSKRVSDVYVLGLFTGTTMQLGDTCSAAMVGKYFDKRLSLGNGIVMAGVGLGTLVLPPFLQWLFDEYTYRGAALIMAAICLNTLVSGALMRPKEIRQTGGKAATFKVSAERDLSSQHSLSANHNESGCSNIAFEIDRTELKEIKDTTFSDSTVSSPSVPKQIARQNTRFSAKSCFNLVKTFAIRPSSGRANSSSLFQKIMFTVRFFKSPEFVLLEIFSFLSTVGVECLVQFYPSFIKELGMSSYQSAFLLSIIGGTDILGRILLGFLGDCNCIGRFKIAIIPQLLLGCVCFLIHFGREFWSQVLFAVFIGLIYGTTYCYRPVLMVDLFGVSTLLRRMGVTSFLTGLGLVAGGPLLGYVRDTTGDFHIPLQVIGGVFFTSGCCLLAVALINFCKRKGRGRNE